MDSGCSLLTERTKIVNNMKIDDDASHRGPFSWFSLYYICLWQGIAPARRATKLDPNRSDVILYSSIEWSALLSTYKKKCRTFLSLSGTFTFRCVSVSSADIVSLATRKRSRTLAKVMPQYGHRNGQILVADN